MLNILHHYIGTKILNRLEPETSHAIALCYLRLLNQRFSRMKDATPGLKTKICGMELASPIGLAAGFDKNAEVFNAALSLGFGFVEVGTITPNPQNGNPSPRLQDVILDGKNGLLNSLGLPGPGVETFIEQLGSSSVWNYRRPIGISIGGHDEIEYIYNLKLIDEKIKHTHEKYFFELNISCPNTTNGKTITDDLDKLEKF